MHKLREYAHFFRIKGYNMYVLSGLAAYSKFQHKMKGKYFLEGYSMGLKVFCTIRVLTVTQSVCFVVARKFPSASLSNQQALNHQVSE